MTLSIAIRDLTPGPKWAQLLKLVDGKEADAVEALSGRLSGRMRLDAEIAAKNIYAETERKRLREFERLRDEIIDAFDARRRSGMELRGHTTASPHKRVTISPDLPLEYDFANNRMQSGDLKFHGVIARKDARKSAADPAPAAAAVSADRLKKFCQERLQESSNPSMKALWEAARQHFRDRRVTRERVRALYRELVPDHLRKQGPRKAR